MVAVGVVLVSPQKHVIPHAFSPTEPWSNNMTEHNALLIGLEVTKEVGAKNLKVYGYSMFIVNQVCKEYVVQHEDLISYYEVDSKMEKESNILCIRYLLRQLNVHADAFASLVASLALSARASKKFLVFTDDLYCPRPLIERNQALTKIANDQKDLATSTDPVQKHWRFPFIDLFLYEILSDDPL